MRIDLTFPAYPPFPDAIGEYMASLATALRQEGVAARAICAREQSVAGRVLKTGGSEAFLDRANVIKVGPIRLRSPSCNIAPSGGACAAGFLG
jgi:hypothetical protein